MSFPCKRFSVELPTNGGCSWLLCGASRSGKTTFMKHIYKEYYKKFITIMFSMNRHADIYKDLDKKVILSDKFLSPLIAEAHDINTVCDNKFPFLFISDDYVDSKIKHDPEITRLLTIHRNANISSIFSFQGRTLVNSVGRNQVNYICIFKQQTPKEWKNVIEEFLDMWLPMDMTMPEKIAFCVEATKDHQLFFVDNINSECYITKLTKAQAS
jgi:GTPase SAR1 family protein